MTVAARRPSLRRRWDRFLLQAEGRLDGEAADRLLPWLAAGLVFTVLVLLDAAAIRSIEGGSGLAPWVQAAWRREHGGAGYPVGGLDPASASWSFVSEPILWLTRLVPAEAVFTTVQALAIALAIVPLWRLARDEARLRVGATLVIVAAFALAPTLHRANLSAFHPELIAVPLLLWGYLMGCRGHWRRFTLLVAVVLACRADLGLSVAALGLLLASQGVRRPGITTALVGLGWSLAAVLALDPQAPGRALTPAGGFVARTTAPLDAFPQLVLHPLSEVRALLAEPSILFLVVVLAPLLFLPLVAPRKLLVALPCLVLAMVADRAVQRNAQERVLTLAPAAAHIGPAIGFVFVALVFAVARVGTVSVTRVNVDRRVLVALLAGATLLFVTEAPSSPYRQPWAWGSRDATDGARLAAVRRIAPDAAVASSPTAAVLVSERGHLLEL
ncbi:MAG: putative rane protein, partial [Acidimicrobiales bacterium]|nr:putative rane protein [Acidimicrobiales bacterium]